MRDVRRWDVFCRVIDNYGDAGVCWRLSRLLAREHGGRVRLCIDDLDTLRRLHPAVTVEPRQIVDGVEIVRWDATLDIAPDSADVIVDAFGCGPPEQYLERAAVAEPRPLWIVLEYLSAELWVAEHHGLASPHPRLPLERYFFFPGFTPSAGGLLRERDLFARREAFDEDARAGFWRDLGFSPPREESLTILMFAYPAAPAAELLGAWADGAEAMTAVLPDGPLAASVLRSFGAPEALPDRVMRCGSLELRFVPFVPQARFDEFLWSCDVNFVRGEDSIVRAQWAARPFVWHIYAQAEEAHRGKLEALLEIYADGLAPAAARSARELFLTWNALAPPELSIAAAWSAYARELPSLRAHGAGWSERLASGGDLAAKLARFCRDKLK